MRALDTVAAGATLAIFTAFGGTVHAVEYDFVSVDASGGSLSQFTRTLPSVNAGATAPSAPPCSTSPMRSAPARRLRS